MGICPSFSPEERAIKHSNDILKDILIKQLQDLTIYNFTTKLRLIIPNISPRYLLNQGIIEDIDKLKLMARKNLSIKTEALSVQNLEEDLRNSCLIMEDQVLNKNNQQQSKTQMYTSFQNNLAKNQSLVVQINIMYEKQFEVNKYKQSLRYFLRWGNVFQEHCYGGFLKPLYKQFCEALYKIPYQQSETIVDEVSIFVQYLITIYTHVYDLQQLSQSDNGQLFKNENVYNMVMSLIFKRTKISKFVRRMIQQRQQKKIAQFQERLSVYSEKDLQFFQVGKQFRLQEVHNYNSFEQNQQQKLINKQPPYSECIKLVRQIASPSQTPITKLKIIVAISKKIMKQIYDYYDSLNSNPQKKIPQLDPDNLTSIIMYLICKAGKKQILEELKIVEYFTTTNCLNCISGFYLNTFCAAIQSILEIK